MTNPEDIADGIFFSNTSEIGVRHKSGYTKPQDDGRISTYPVTIRRKERYIDPVSGDSICVFTWKRTKPPTS